MLHDHCPHCWTDIQYTGQEAALKCPACGNTLYLTDFESEQNKINAEILAGKEAKAALDAAVQEKEKWQEELRSALSSFDVLMAGQHSENQLLNSLLSSLHSGQQQTDQALSNLLSTALSARDSADDKLSVLQQITDALLSGQTDARQMLLSLTSNTNMQQNMLRYFQTWSQSAHADHTKQLEHLRDASAQLLSAQSHMDERIAALKQNANNTEKRLAAFHKQWQQKQLDVLNNTYNQAKSLHNDRKFDQAEIYYRKVIIDGGESAEVYWRMLMCHYGVEYQYTKDERRYVPTLLRPDLSDYSVPQALFNCPMTAAQRADYEQKLNEIERILDKYRQVSGQMQYDVFLSVKQTDDNGHHTADSDSASTLYDFLTQQGLKVFNSRRCTHEIPAGQNYEPYIIAALLSAKVLIVVGSCPEHMNAQWVRNEWSRFQWMQSADKNRLLFCYLTGGMSAYDIPRALHPSHQAITDSVTAHDALIATLSPYFPQLRKASAPVTATPVSSAPAANTPAQIAPLLRRAFLFLEDGDWQSANEYCERVLDMDPENSEAYLAKLMIDLQVRQQQDLGNCDTPFDANNNYKKALRFGSPALTNTLQGYISRINERIENAKYEKLYEEASDVLLHADDSPEELKRASELFAAISYYKDSAELAQSCADAAESIIRNRENEYITAAYNEARSLMERATTDVDFRVAARHFEKLIPNGDAAKMRDACLEKAEAIRKDNLYNEGKSAMSAGNTLGYTIAIHNFQSISGWRYADALLIQCQNQLNNLKAEQKKAQEAARKEAEKAAAEKARHKKKRNILISLTALIVCVVYFVYSTVIIPSRRYNNAVILKEAGFYHSAILAFSEIKDYKDSASKIEECERILVEQHLETEYNSAVALMDAGKYEEAISAFKTLNGYKDSTSKIYICETIINGQKENE